jgi:hypothetical protein
MTAAIGLWREDFQFRRSGADAASGNDGGTDDCR